MDGLTSSYVEEDMYVDNEEQPAKDEVLGPDQAHDAEESGEAAWDKLRLDEQCRRVMNHLEQEDRRWDKASGNPNVLALEDYKKTSLTGRDDWHYKQTPTVLHLLAMNWEEEFQGFAKTSARRSSGTS